MKHYGYTFTDLKSIYKEFGMGKVNDEWVAYRRDNDKFYYTSPELVAKVKFAYTWIKATEYGRSRDTFRPEITKMDEEYAFNNGAAETYQAIMSKSYDAMIKTGLMYDEEELENKVEQNNLQYKYSKSIVQGLYQDEKYRKSFEDYIRYSTGNPELYPENQSQNNGFHM